MLQRHSSERSKVKESPLNKNAKFRNVTLGGFDKMLAKPEEARTTFSSRLLVETARKISKRKADEAKEDTVAKIKSHKAEVRKNLTKRKSSAGKKRPGAEHD